MSPEPGALPQPGHTAALAQKLRLVPALARELATVCGRLLTGFASPRRNRPNTPPEHPTRTPHPNTPVKPRQRAAFRRRHGAGFGLGFGPVMAPSWPRHGPVMAPGIGPGMAPAWPPA